MNNYDFRTWQTDEKDSRSLVKLKEWIAGKFSIYQPDKNIYIRTDGRIGWCVQSGELEPDDYFIFEPTLLPCFFDEFDIHGTLIFIGLPDIWQPAIFTHRVGASSLKENYMQNINGREPADHALYTRMFQLLEERLTN